MLKSPTNMTFNMCNFRQDFLLRPDQTCPDFVMFDMDSFCQTSGFSVPCICSICQLQAFLFLFASVFLLTYAFLFTVGFLTAPTFWHLSPFFLLLLDPFASSYNPDMTENLGGWFREGVWGFWIPGGLPGSVIGGEEGRQSTGKGSGKDQDENP